MKIQQARDMIVEKLEESTLLQEREKLVQALLPQVPDALKYDELNMLEWSEYVQLILTRRGLEEHLTTLIDETNPNFKTWRKEDAQIRAWLLGIFFRKYLFLQSTKVIWDQIDTGCSKRNQDWRIYSLVCKAATLVQGDRSVMAYFTELQAIWTEIDHFRPVKNPESEEWGYTIKDRLYKFLMGLNIEYEPLRNQFLNREKVPTIEETINILLEEERRMKLVPNAPKEEASAILASKGKIHVLE